jgi:hypothetical protein
VDPSLNDDNDDIAISANDDDDIAISANDDDDIAIAANDDDDLQLLDIAASSIFNKFSKPTTACAVVSPLKTLPRKKTHLLSVKSSESLFPARSEPMVQTELCEQAARHCVTQAVPRTTIAQSLPAAAVVQSSSCTEARRESVSPTTATKAGKKTAAEEGPPVQLLKVQQIPGSQVQAVRPMTQPSSALQAVFRIQIHAFESFRPVICGLKKFKPPPPSPPKKNNLANAVLRVKSQGADPLRPFSEPMTASRNHLKK